MKTADVFHYANAKIPEISVGSSDQSIFGITSGSGPVISVNQNFLTLPFLTNRFIIAVLLLTYVASSEKEYKLVRAKSLLPVYYRPVSSDVIDPACNKYHIRALCPFLDFLAGIFRRSQKEARGSRFGLAGSQNSLLRMEVIAPQRTANRGTANGQRV